MTYDGKHVGVTKEMLLRKVGREILQCVNMKGYAILHLAALDGYIDIINIILRYAKGAKAL